MSRTKIIATIGPACRNPETLEELVKAGVDVARINCSHADHDSIASISVDVREISQKLDKSVGVLLDLSGPKIRTGTLKDNIAVELEQGKYFTLTSRKVEGSKDIVSTNYALLSKELQTGDTVLLDDGLLELKVLKTDDTDAECEI